jgi:hypothetical protein
MTDDQIIMHAKRAITFYRPSSAEPAIYTPNEGQLIAFARAIAAAEREACIRAVDDAGGDNTEYHIDAIRARGESHE